MRLWHKDYIPVLPDKLLMQQWRDLCVIARQIHETGSPKSPVVQPLMNYPLSHLRSYAVLVEMECVRRRHRIRPLCFWRYFPEYNPVVAILPAHPERIFPEWHNTKYKTQCFFMLMERRDCGQITQMEWETVRNYIAGGKTNETGARNHGVLARA